MKPLEKEKYFKPNSEFEAFASVDVLTISSNNSDLRPEDNPVEWGKYY